MIKRYIFWIKWYSLIIGILIILSWIFLLINGNLPEGKAELSFHISSEFLMAFICVIGGCLLHKKIMIGVRFCLAGLSMIFYSTMNAIGYYIENYNLSMVVMLSIICLINFIFLIKIIKN